MAAGDTVTELDKSRSIVLYLNTGTTDANGKAIVDHTTINGIDVNATEQNMYDFAYTLGGLTSKSVDDIDVRETTELGPIS